jgi:hypothetical protein
VKKIVARLDPAVEISESKERAKERLMGSGKGLVKNFG